MQEIINEKLFAEDKLNEAFYFLGLLKRFHHKIPEMFYYLSAFLSATRSISFVLQKDLKGQFGETFETWWDLKIKEMDGTTIEHFKTIKNLRNNFLKEGNSLPISIIKKYKSYELKTEFDINLGICRKSLLKYDKSMKDCQPQFYWNLFKEINMKGKTEIEGFIVNKEIKTLEDLFKCFETYLIEMKKIINQASELFTPRNGSVTIFC
jgi:hypothetical protein